MENAPLIPAPDQYRMVLLAIEKMEDPDIAVPRLAEMLGVKATTLNARFRRQQIQVRTVGRTNYISSIVARELATLHQSALIGWPTLKEASRLSGVKAFTLKAKCEKGQLMCSTDLTKRLRIDPAEFEKLTSSRCTRPVQQPQPRKSHRGTKPIPRPPGIEAGTPSSAHSSTLQQTAGNLASHSPAHAVPLSTIQILRAKDYGLSEVAPTVSLAGPKTITDGKAARSSECLSYCPERPFSVSLCRLGKRVRYERYEGTIIEVVDDPFSPRIKVSLRDHPHPLMQEVMLLVGRRTR